MLVTAQKVVRARARAKARGQWNAGSAEVTTWPAIAQVAIRLPDPKARARASPLSASIVEETTLPETARRVERARARVARARVSATTSETMAAASLEMSAVSATKHREENLTDVTCKGVVGRRGVL